MYIYIEIDLYNTYYPAVTEGGQPISLARQ